MFKGVFLQFLLDINKYSKYTFFVFKYLRQTIFNVMEGDSIFSNALDEFITNEGVEKETLDVGFIG